MPKSARPRKTAKPAPTTPRERAADTPPPGADAFARIAPFYDSLMSSIPYREWADYIEKIMRYKGFRPRSILDVACGTGTVSLLLAARGYDVTGVDISAPMIEIAKEKAGGSHNCSIPFLCQDASQLKVEGKFDLAISLYDSFNYILEDERLLAAFRRVRRALHPGGLLFFDLNSLYSFQAELFTQRSFPDSEVGYEWISHFDPHRAICEVKMHFDPPEGEPFDVTHLQRAYLVEEVVRLLKRARFELIDLFDAYTLLPPGRYSERIFYLAKRREYPAKKRRAPQKP